MYLYVQSCMHASCTGVHAALQSLFNVRWSDRAPLCLLQLALIVPYMRIGEWMTGSPHVTLAPVGIRDLFKHGSGGGRQRLLFDHLSALACCTGDFWMRQSRIRCTPSAPVYAAHDATSCNRRGALCAADLLRSVGCAVLAWVLTWPLIAGGLYLALAPAFQLLRRQ